MDYYLNEARNHIETFVGDQEPQTLQLQLTTLHKRLKKCRLREDDTHLVQGRDQFYQTTEARFNAATRADAVQAGPQYLFVVCKLGTFEEVLEAYAFLGPWADAYTDDTFFKLLGQTFHTLPDPNVHHPHILLFWIQQQRQPPIGADVNHFLGAWNAAATTDERRFKFAAAALCRQQFRQWFMRIEIMGVNVVTELAAACPSPEVSISLAYALHELSVPQDNAERNAEQEDFRLEAQQAYVLARAKLDVFLATNPERKVTVAELTSFASFAWEINANNLGEIGRLNESNEFLDLLLLPQHWPLTLTAGPHGNPRVDSHDDLVANVRQIDIAHPQTETHEKFEVHFTSAIFAVWIRQILRLYLDDTPDDIDEMHIVVGKQNRSAATNKSMWSDILLPTCTRLFVGGLWVPNCQVGGRGCKVFRRQQLERVANVDAVEFVRGVGRLPLP
eukprot:TRINITY_DN7363_c0_g1_i1.p1 TRINITY_DN7363_c0_g1~~TRINITY_DN7363_c0_g1_i1.p1  ORF type:complete len:458 (+),score=71.59 TRINITY_DN7363_c0_g1_i1:36-1376(+)